MVFPKRLGGCLLSGVNCIHKHNSSSCYFIRAKLNSISLLLLLLLVVVVVVVVLLIPALVVQQCLFSGSSIFVF
jgi:hypothetical protein